MSKQTKTTEPLTLPTGEPLPAFPETVSDMLARHFTEFNDLVVQAFARGLWEHWERHAPDHAAFVIDLSAPSKHWIRLDADIRTHEALEKQAPKQLKAFFKALGGWRSGLRSTNRETFGRLQSRFSAFSSPRRVEKAAFERCLAILTQDPQACFGTAALDVIEKALAQEALQRILPVGPDASRNRF